MDAVKGIWIVQAGVLPGQPMTEYTKKWDYMSSEFEHDNGERFAEHREQAMDYAKSIMIPSLVNWVKVEFIWL